MVCDPGTGQHYLSRPGREETEFIASASSHRLGRELGDYLGQMSRWKLRKPRWRNFEKLA